MFSFDIDKKICLIKQPAGLGDILYSQKIAKQFKSQGYKIDWYVISSFMWIRDYIKGINFIDKKTDEIYTPLNDSQMYSRIFLGNHPFSNEDMTYLPLLFAHHHYPKMKVMNSKYKMANIDDSDWANYLTYKRFNDKEDKLFYEILGLKDGEEYCLISEKINSYGSEILKTNYQGSLKKVYLDYIDGFTIIDWCKVIEKASEIHFTDSSATLITETLNLSTDKLFVYSRRKNDYSEIDYLYKKPYKFLG